MLSIYYSYQKFLHKIFSELMKHFSNLFHEKFKFLLNFLITQYKQFNNV